MSESQSPKRVEIFLSYAREDEKLRDELVKHLSALKRQGVISEWHDGEILAGAEQARETEQRLIKAQIILLLISPDFMASKYLWQMQVRRAMERHEAGEAVVIPVLLRAVDWHGASFEKLVPLPWNQVAVTSWANQDEAFKAVVIGIRATVAELIESTEGDIFQVVDKLALNSVLKARLFVDELVLIARQQIQPYIWERCGTMRVLDMTQPIGLDTIYTSVNILEKITGRRGLSTLELLQKETDSTQFERFWLGDVREKRVPALEAIAQFPKLMILGKPGAGKTTFLKHLAVQCIGGKVQADRIPIFITLKDFAETSGKPNLLTYIDRLVAISPIERFRWNTSTVENFAVQEILYQGRALVLLDGLDEVRDIDHNRVLRQIRDFSQRFPQNQFVITCRIAAREYVFEKFTEVEVADFDNEQIADFSNKWFCSKDDPIKAAGFLQALKDNMAIWELATSPLLLTLLCLVFEDSGSFPLNRAELYKTGVEVLLKKWDTKRNIERDQVYKKLSLKRKEDLLSQIALTTFEAGNYFFKQREVERYISQYIQNLPEFSTDSEVLELDSAVVLESIEAQHGLFVERARGIYSFSHLTFHEYFTACKIVTNCNPEIANDPTLQKLVSHLAEKRWREVFLLTVGMIDSADCLLRLMKEQINRLLADDPQLQEFLAWVAKTSRFIDVPYKPAAVRSFYFTLVPALDRALYHDRDLALALDRDLAHDLTLPLDRTLALALDRALYRGRGHNLVQNPKLQLALQMLRKELPDISENDQNRFEHWWQQNGQEWISQLRTLMGEHYNIGYAWQFNDDQIRQLRQYYASNKLLIDCLNSDCYVSRPVRQEIEETLLLPLAEIKNKNG